MTNDHEGGCGDGGQQPHDDETIEEQYIREGRDQMGYPLAPIMSLFTEGQIHAAKRLAAAHGWRWDVVGRDPRVIGWRFLRDAKIALGGGDLGEKHPEVD